MAKNASTWLKDTLDYTFEDARLLELALTHRSARGDNNERLEFLGDAVLDLVVAEELISGVGDPLSRAMLLAVRAEVRHASGASASALVDLRDAEALTPEHSSTLRAVERARRALHGDPSGTT